LEWARGFYSAVKGQLGCTRGQLLHLWHGEPEDRKYVMMNALLVKHRFNPLVDLRFGSDGCWEWASEKPELHAEVTKYFFGRQEDAR
jgi:hypothetical protein